jgi:hypothetical protein
MARTLDPTIAKVLSEYGEDPKAALWDCHGTWVVLHKAIERMAARAKIVFAAPTIIEARSADKIAVICVSGTMGERSEWSIGEAAPGNNKNAYPYAMAEKRAKDRVALKLLGLHGLAYSEDESDDFKEPAGNTPSKAGRGADGSHPQSSAPTNLRDPADIYTEAALQIIDTFAGEAAALSSWWRTEAATRAEHGITKGTPHYEALFGALLAKGEALAPKEAA